MLSVTVVLKGDGITLDSYYYYYLDSLRYLLVLAYKLTFTCSNSICDTQNTYSNGVDVF